MNLKQSITQRRAFTLIELLVVISIIAMLLSIMLPALRRARDAGRSVVCRNHLRTLALANELYAASAGNWYVSVIDTTMTDRDEPTWNSNALFRSVVGLDNAYVGNTFTMPGEYLCPDDRQSNEAYWQQVGGLYQNFVSYGYNLTDWGPYSRAPVNWSGNLPASDWACRWRTTEIRMPATKIMFTDAGDIWARMHGANYKLYWDREGQDIIRYRSRNMWHPVYYRHRESANVVYFDGHVEAQKKESLYFYNPPDSMAPDQPQNERTWFVSAANRRASSN